MNALFGIRRILQGLAQNVEVLPAVGGAVEDLERPDIEEREDQRLNRDERVFETVFERTPDLSRPPLYRFVPPVGRTQEHRFRYFLDGSFRSYFLGTVLEHERESPVHFAQIGACVLRREEEGTVRRAEFEVENLLLIGKQRLSESVWERLHTLCADADIRTIDIAEHDIFSDAIPDIDLRNKAAGKVRYLMRTLEARLMGVILAQLPADQWLIVDGSLLFEPILSQLMASQAIPSVIGVSKNFRKDPQFVFGRGPRAERRSIFRLLRDLEPAHRSAAFSAREGKVVFWYVRLREQRHLDYPLMGVVKVELANPSQEPVDSSLIDQISCALVAERAVAPHGQDRRWHAHLYPIFLAERAAKESFLSREVVRQSLQWR